MRLIDVLSCLIAFEHLLKFVLSVHCVRSINECSMYTVVSLPSMAAFSLPTVQKQE